MDLLAPSLSFALEIIGFGQGNYRYAQIWLLRVNSVSRIKKEPETKPFH